MLEIPTEKIGNKTKPSSCILNNNNIVVCWVEKNAQNNVYCGLFNRKGYKLRADFKVNKNFQSGNQGTPFVIALSTGGFIVTYYDTSTGTM